MDDVFEVPQDTERVQSALRSRPATLNDLLKKRRRETTVVIPAVDDDGHDIELKVRIQAISSKQYDDLLAKHPPTSKQRQEGASYNMDTFAPALISAVALEPRMTLEDAAALYTSDEWSSGEIGGLFIAALKLCNAGLDVPFNGAG